LRASDLLESRGWCKTLWRTENIARLEAEKCGG
jgi:hypothetical protein